MILPRRSSERGIFDHGWLKTAHTFSFAGYFDPKFMGFRSLRVINEDRVAPGQGFGAHSHRDMEILSIVLDGELAHQDSMGNGSVIRAGEIQYMSAGTGVQHSEFNHSQDRTTHFLQIWIVPAVRGAPPRYDQREIPREEKIGKLRLIAGGSPVPGAVELRQDAQLYASILEAGSSLTARLAPDRGGYVQVLRGRVAVNGAPLNAGDGAFIESEPSLAFTAGLDETEFLLFDLA